MKKKLTSIGWIMVVTGVIGILLNEIPNHEHGFTPRQLAQAASCKNHLKEEVTDKELKFLGPVSSWSVFKVENPDPDVYSLTYSCRYNEKTGYFIKATARLIETKEPQILVRGF